MSEHVAIPPDYLADMDWALAHAQELHNEYENQWVAVVGGRVVASGSDPSRVRDTAARRCSRDPERIFIDYVENGAAVYGLWQP